MIVYKCIIYEDSETMLFLIYGPYRVSFALEYCTTNESVF